MFKRREILLGSTAMMVAGGSAQAKLPDVSVWTAYDLGSSGYAEASGIADAIMKKQPMKVRIVPSGTSIGRQPKLSSARTRSGLPIAT